MTTTDKAPDDTARLFVIDINGTARAFRLVVFGMYFMMVLALLKIPHLAFVLFTEPSLALAVIFGAMIVAWSADALFGWKWAADLDVIVHPFAIPALTVVIANGVLTMALPNLKYPAIATFDFWGAAVAVMAVVALLLLRRDDVPFLNVTVGQLLRDGFVRSPGPRLRPAAPVRMWLTLLLALGWFLGLDAAAGFLDRHLGTNQGRMLLPVLGFVLLVRARQYAQPAFNEVVAHDHRPPVLFLRSFADDQYVFEGSFAENIWNNLGFMGYGLVDYSLESRLATHFSAFGPFIAVGAPQDKHPHLGAARVQLSHDEWQAYVLKSIDASRLVVAMAGATKWFAWELESLIAGGHAKKTLVVFPSIQFRFGTKGEASGPDARLSCLATAFRDTIWGPGLAKLTAAHDPRTIRAIVFEPGGAVVAFTAKMRNRASYHLAAVFGHGLLERPLLHDVAADPPGARQAANAGSWSRGLMSRRLFGILVAAAFCAAAIYTISPERKESSVLIGNQDRVYYGHGASKEMAESLGSLLKAEGFFTDRGISVRLSKKGETSVVSVEVQDGSWDKENNALSFGIMAVGIAPAMGGFPITMELLDSTGHVRRAVGAGRAAISKRDEIYYLGTATDANARRLADAMRAENFYDDHDSTIVLSMGGRTTIGFVVGEGYWDRPDVVLKFEPFVRQIAPAIGGLPIHVCLMNNRLDIKKELDVNGSPRTTSDAR